VSEPDSSSPPSQDATAMPGGDFRLFVQKIALQGFYALGLIELPGQERPEPNLRIAQAVIDDLRMLREKTQGNLSEGERLTLDKFVTDLEFQFVAVKEREGGRPGAGCPEKADS